MNIRPPMTIDTSASDRASGPVNVVSRFEAARSHGDCAKHDKGTATIASAIAVTRATWRVLIRAMEVIIVLPEQRTIRRLFIIGIRNISRSRFGMFAIHYVNTIEIEQDQWQVGRALRG
jgi:hypothetical protein